MLNLDEIAAFSLRLNPQSIIKTQQKQLFVAWCSDSETQQLTAQL
ncbi:hypothetical protein [Spirulina subsalsa]|nr:hypothetical protein [Spirulina subsalsa]